MVSTSIICVVLSAIATIIDAYTIQHDKRSISNPCGHGSANTGALICQPWDKTVDDLIVRLTGISDEVDDIIKQNYDFPASFIQLLPLNITGLIVDTKTETGGNLTKHDAIPFLTLAFNDFTVLVNCLKVVTQSALESPLQADFANARAHIVDLKISILIGLRGLGSDAPEGTSVDALPDEVAHTKCKPCRDFQVLRDLKTVVDYFKDCLQEQTHFDRMI